MRMFVIAILLLCGSCLSTFACAKADRSSSLHALAYALNSGNAGEVRRIVQAGSVDPKVAEIANAQLSYNISRMIQLAKQCDDESLSHTHTLAEANYCSGITVSAATFLGDAHDVLAQMLWVNTYLDHEEAEQLGHKKIHKSPFANLTSAESRSIVSRTPHVSLDWRANEGSVPIDHADAFSSIEPRIRVDINGHSVVALINTMLPVAFPVLIVRPTMGVGKAPKLGLTSLLPATSTDDAPSAASVATEGSTPWEIADTVKVGPLVVHHMLVLVTRSDELPSGVYITNALLRRFGEVVIGKNKVSFFRHGTGDCLTGANMTFVADAKLQGRLVFPVTVAGQKGAATFYSDNSVPLQIVQGALSIAPASSRSAKSTHQLRQGPIAVTVGAHTYNAEYVLMGKKLPGPLHVVIGNSVLRSHSVHLAFDGHDPMFCVSKAGK